MNKNEITKIYKEFHTPKHVIAHMKVVAKVAKNLGLELKHQKTQVDVDLIEKAALLHDVVRCVDFKNLEEKSFAKKPKKSDYDCWKNLWKKYHKIGHEKAMAKILKSRGENKLSKLVAKHGFFSIWELKSIEEKVLYYADKRVDRDKIVTLKVRFEEGKKRNFSPSDDQKLVKRTELKVFELEEEFSKILRKSVDQL